MACVSESALSTSRHLCSSRAHSHHSRLLYSHSHACSLFPSLHTTLVPDSSSLLQDLSRCQQRLAEAEAARLAHISQAQAALVSQEEHDRVLQQLQQFKMLEESNVGLR